MTTRETFDVDKALKAWEKNYPVRGERIIVLRGMLYSLEDGHQVRTQKGLQTAEYPHTASCLRQMLDAEGAAR